MNEIAGALAGLFEEAPLLGRVFSASIELLLLATIVALAIKLKLVRTHRLQSLLWCIVLLNALCGLAFHAPLELAVWRNAAQTSAPVAPSPKPKFPSVLADFSLQPPLFWSLMMRFVALYVPMYSC